MARSPAVAATGRAAALVRHESETSAARVARGQVRLPSLWLPAWADLVLASRRTKTASLVAALRLLAEAEGIAVPDEKT